MLNYTDWTLTELIETGSFLFSLNITSNNRII